MLSIGKVVVFLTGYLQYLAKYMDGSFRPKTVRKKKVVKKAIMAWPLVEELFAASLGNRNEGLGYGCVFGYFDPDPVSLHDLRSGSSFSLNTKFVDTYIIRRLNSEIGTHV